MSTNIGIKVANGEFYPILSENSVAKKRMVLTTAHDGQRSVQIDLYRNSSRTMSNAQYIGSLVVENIKRKKKGEPSVELVLSSDVDGEIFAEAKDLDSPQGTHSAQLSISLRSLTDNNQVLPAFEDEADNSYEILNLMSAGQPKKSFSKWAIIIPVVLLLLTGAGILFWYFSSIHTQQAPAVDFKPPQTDISEAPAAAPIQEEPVQAIPPPPPPQEIPVISEPVAPPVVAAPQPAAPPPSGRMIAPVYSFNVPSVIPKNGFIYKVRWGDTLWDISQAFYHNPWRYKYLARYNNIRNPNHIISGRSIRIPPR